MTSGSSQHHNLISRVEVQLSNCQMEDECLPPAAECHKEKRRLDSGRVRPAKRRKSMSSRRTRIRQSPKPTEAEVPLLSLSMMPDAEVLHILSFLTQCELSCGSILPVSAHVRCHIRFFS
jgi:hypothetical protein